MNITAISMEQFKCFDELHLSCAPLTVLTGYNAAGKSTTLHSLLLMAQALRAHPHSDLLALNGELVSLGTGTDILAPRAKRLRLGLRNEQEVATWTFRYDRQSSRRGRMPLDRLDYEHGGGSVQQFRAIGPDATFFQNSLCSRVRDTIFLGAARVVQLEAYPIPRSQWQITGDVGARGQYAPYWYVECSDELVPSRRRYKTTNGNGGERGGETVRSQVDTWIGAIFPGARVRTRRLSNVSPVELSFRLGYLAPWAKPSNVGYGLGYAFSMIISFLTAAEGAIIVVDSAEAHLHPRAQSAVGKLIGQMAGAGLQVLLETHSDHLLNGIRLAVRDRLLEPEDVAIHFFEPRSTLDGNQVTTLSVDRSGGIESWPEGFFDQAERDLATLAGW